MNKLTVFLKDKWFYIIGIVLPWIIAVLYCYINDLWFTGHGNIAVGDMLLQNIPIAYELWDKVHTGQSFAYTWHIIGGVDFHALLNYMMSPFTIIMLLLPRDRIPDYMQLVMIVKWSMASFSMIFYFYHTKFNTLTRCRKMVSMFLGLAYALSNGILSYIIYMQFMDAIICFPFLLLLLEKMVQDKRWKLYYLILTFSIFSNNYIAFQICIFLVMYFGLLLFSDVKERGKKFIIFAGSSLLAGLTNAGGIIMGLLMASGRLETNDARLTDYISGLLVKPYDFLQQMYPFRGIEAARSYLPNIYFSVIAAALFILFPLLKIEKKKKIYMLCIAVFMIISFLDGRLSLLWHLFNVPNGVYHRFMYLYIFYMLFLVLNVLIHLKDLDLHKIMGAGVAALLIYLYVFLNIKQFDEPIIYVAALLIVVFCYIMLTLYVRKSIGYRNILYIIVICGLLELIPNAYNAFAFFNNDIFYGKEGWITEAAGTLENVELVPGERIALESPTTNIGLIAGQNTDAGFLSMMNSSNKLLHERLGMKVNSMTEYAGIGGSPLANLIYNIRYCYGESEVLFSDVEPVEKGWFFKLYRTNRLAGLGYMVDEAVTSWNPDSDNCYTNQNDYVNKAVGESGIFQAVNPDIKCCDLAGRTYDFDEKEREQGLYSYSFVSEYGDDFDARQYEFEADRDMDLYMHYITEYVGYIDIYVDGKNIHSDAEGSQISGYHIGKLRKGQSVIIMVSPGTLIPKGKKYSHQFIFADFDEEAYERVYKKLCRNVYRIEVEESDDIKGHINVDKPGIMMTSIPADTGFSVMVDGNRVSYEVIGGALIGVPLDVGEHEVEFSYKSPYTGIQWYVMAGGLAVFAIISAVGKRRSTSSEEVE